MCLVDFNMGFGLSLSDRIFVKEQRVYGSWRGLSRLRCILPDFERNWIIKVPSKQIILLQHNFKDKIFNITPNILLFIFFSFKLA
jgi:hypothetical protein